MICKIKHFHKANKTTKAKNLNKKSFQRKKSANKYENLIKNVTTLKQKASMYTAQFVATDSDSQFAFNQSLCIAAIDLDPCAHSPMINKIRDRNHFNVLQLCVLRLSLLWPATRSISLRMDILTWNFNLAAVGKQIFFASIWQRRYKMWLIPLRTKTSPQKATSLCGRTSGLFRARIFARAEGVNPALPGPGGSLESCTTPSIMSSNSDTSFMCILCGKTIAIHQRPNSRWGWFTSTYIQTATFSD